MLPSSFPPLIIAVHVEKLSFVGKIGSFSLLNIRNDLIETDVTRFSFFLLLWRYHLCYHLSYETQFGAESHSLQTIRKIRFTLSSYFDHYSMNPTVVSTPSSVYSAPMQSIQSSDSTSISTVPHMEAPVNPPAVTTIPVTVTSSNGNAVTESSSNPPSFPTESQLQQSMSVTGYQSVSNNGNPTPVTVSGNTYPAQMQQPSEVSSVSYCSYSQTTTPYYTPQQYPTQQPEYMPQPQYVQQQPQYVPPQPQYMPQQQYMVPQSQYGPPGYMPQQPSYPTQQHIQVRILFSCHL